jgi:uracil-DNA glycosylase
MDPLEEKKERILKQALFIEKTFGVESLPPEWLGSTSKDESSWEGLKAKALACTQCRLHESRNHVVFGEGNPQADLMFIGEAPGFEEDRQGAPFVGKAGQLLTRIIEAMGLKRQDVYIANCLKCRPPQNRNPHPDEIASCQPFLRQQIDSIQPKVICALGKFAAQTLLQTESPISRLRGKFQDYMGIRLMPTFHPAYLLRNPQDKQLVWNDIQLVMKELGLKNVRHAGNPS